MIKMLMMPISFVCFCAVALQITLGRSSTGDKKMKTRSTHPVIARDCREDNTRSDWLKFLAKSSALVCLVMVSVTGCVTPTRLSPEDLTPYGSVKLTEGDAVSITFPGSPNLNTAQKIRRDGKIELQVVGELMAAGKTPGELQKEILGLYKDQLVIKEVLVTAQTSTFPVFVTGAVTHPGKVLADRPISALEALMEAGGFDISKANMKKVTVLRNDAGQLKRYVLDMKSVLEGHSKQLFYLRPNDIVYVPEKSF